MGPVQEHTRRELPFLLLVPLIPLLLLLVAVQLLTWLTYAVVLHLALWIVWCSRGTNVLLVYSESPIWQDYIESEILPRLPRSTVVLNWSQRRQWKYFSLRVRAFRLFGGDREFNPMVIVFRPLRWTKTFRFWKAFRDYKHGKEGPLETLQREMLHCVGPKGTSTAGKQDVEADGATGSALRRTTK